MTPEHYRRALRRLDLAYGVGLLTWRMYLSLLKAIVAEHGEAAVAAIKAARRNPRLN
jgi:hypothetical protein